MAITVFSRIQREHLREMYLSYCYSRSGNQSDAACSDKVLGLVALYARAAIIDLVAETRTEDFFRERVRIVAAMTRVVREAVAQRQAVRGRRRSPRGALAHPAVAAAGEEKTTGPGVR